MSNYARYVKGETGPVMDYTPGNAVSAGQVVVVGDLVGVAKLDIAANVAGQLHFGGVYDFPKATSGGSGQAQGVTMYWDATNSVATPTSTGNKVLGKMEKASADADTTARIIMAPWVLVTFNPVTANIADPGNAGAIPVTASGNVQIVTAGAETRTVAAPTFAGQQLLIGFKTKVGNCVVTFSANIDGTNNTVTLSAAGQAIKVEAAPSGAGFVWNLAYNGGTALSHA